MTNEQLIEEMLLDSYVLDVLSKANEYIKNGGKIFFKWTCKSCGERATSSESNGLHHSYSHDECGYTTKTIEGDLGFLLIVASGKN